MITGDEARTPRYCNAVLRLPPALQVRPHQPHLQGPLFQQLFQQLLVDAFAEVQADRLHFIRQHQEALRTETVRGIAAAIDAGEVQGAAAASRIAQY